LGLAIVVMVSAIITILTIVAAYRLRKHAV
jgi:hypothetical protein